MRNNIRRGVAILLVVSLIASALLLSGCGYNRIMREHLSDADNYYEFILEVEKIETVNDVDDYENWYLPIESAADLDLGNLVRVRVTCKVLYSNDNFDKSDDDKWYDKHPSITFEILKVNVEYLLNTDFFNVVKVGDTLNVRSSLWIYMDGDFNYFAGISLNDVTYLPFDKGLQNIIDHMNANKSLL